MVNVVRDSSEPTEAPGGFHGDGDVQARDREEKIERGYEGKALRLTDLVRCSLLFTAPDQMETAVDLILTDSAVDISGCSIALWRATMRGRRALAAGTK